MYGYCQNSNTKVMNFHLNADNIGIIQYNGCISIHTISNTQQYIPSYKISKRNYLILRKLHNTVIQSILFQLISFPHCDQLMYTSFTVYILLNIFHIHITLTPKKKSEFSQAYVKEIAKH